MEEKDHDTMKPILIPDSYNYIAVFLTAHCNLNCSYCINHFNGNRFTTQTIPGRDLVKGLNRIQSRDDLPLTIEGGEPTLHPDFYYILNNIRQDLKIDLLTNLQFNIEEFLEHLTPQRFKRDAPYASIRVSYHPEQMELDEIVSKVSKILNAGYNIGIWGILHPSYEKIVLSAQERCRKKGIDFRTKEFLGEHRGKLYGTYKFPAACQKRKLREVECRTSELIIGSDANVYRCHSDLYEKRTPVGHLLDPDFQIEDRFRPCSYFGHCNPCDIKVKTDRFQIYGHTSVSIKFNN